MMKNKVIKKYIQKFLFYCYYHYCFEVGKYTVYIDKRERKKASDPPIPRLQATFKKFSSYFSNKTILFYFLHNFSPWHFYSVSRS